jgi:predicted RNase H-like HicB family nuclease
MMPYLRDVKRTFKLVIEKDKETGRWSAVFPELPGCASAGDTKLEAVANAREALELWFEPPYGREARDNPLSPRRPSPVQKSSRAK